MRRSWILITLFAAACGSSKPPAPSTGTGSGGVESITGRERIGWDQPAADVGELGTFRFAIYVDNVRSELAEVSCASNAGAAGFGCSGKLPSMSNGAHTLEIAAFSAVNSDSGESNRSNPLHVIVSSALASESAPAADWQSGEIDPTHDGVRLRVDRLADGLETPADAAFAPDGRLFIAERSGHIRIFSDGQLQRRDALSLPSDPDTGMPQAALSIAFDPDFPRSGFVFVLYTAESRDGPAVFLARYRELRGTLAQRAVLFQSTLEGETHAAAVMRFGPDGKLYVAVSGDGANGRLFRLNPDGTMPRDQAGTTPAVAAGVARVRGLAWHPSNAILWIVDDESDAAHLSGVSMSAPPVRAVVRARTDLDPGAGSLVFYTADALPQLRDNGLIASTAGYILRLRFARDDGTRVAESEKLLENRVGAIRVVTVSPQGAIYFCTDTTLGSLSPVNGSSNK